MAGKVAIIAHFDPNDRIEPTVIDMLRCLEQVFDRILFVSTSAVDPAARSNLTKTEIIERPNIGYDFYSYRVGLNRVEREGGADRVLLLNNSILILDTDKFTEALRQMSALAPTHGAVGATLSHQFAEHLQSYMLLLGRRVLDAAWFQNFVDAIEPLGDKMEIVRRYELGLTASLKDHGETIAALFTPSPEQVMSAKSAWLRWRKAHGGADLRPRTASTADQYNPVQFHAEDIGRALGFIKAEVLRDNPHGIDLSFVEEIASPERRADINWLVEQSRLRYRPAEPGKLATVAVAPTPTPTARRAVWGTPHARGIRLAVLLHAYFPDVLEEIIGCLANIVEPFDLYVTTPHEELVAPIFRLGAVHAASVTVAVTENRGRDIGPFVSLLRQGAFDCYLGVLKLHTKKSHYSRQGDTWRRSLVNELIGDSLKVRRAVSLLETGEAGIVGPHADYLSHPSFWGSNRARVATVLETLNAKSGAVPPLGFFAGSMFWFAPPALKSLQAVPEEVLVFEQELGQQDGTLAHALERAFAPLARAQGFRTTSLALKGAEIAETDTSGNRVPVL
ncbi:MAG: rhamnan synthesis F family protein [Rhizobiaceae bacterium]